MSTGKRLAKRSILGTKVMVPGVDGLFRPGFIQAMKTTEPLSSSDAAMRYSVRLEGSGRAFEFAARDVVGPGFGSVADAQLLPGQRVFVTHHNREVTARVVRHDAISQDVLLAIEQQTNGEPTTVLVKIDDVRLLESRKSARLVNSDTDFSKLNDVVISNDRDASANTVSSRAIEVPRSDYVQIAGSRKRRTSENVADDESVLSECSAAMLLMKLSCSPAAAATASNKQQQQFYMSDLPSPAGSSSGVSAASSSAFRSATPSPPLSSSATDEGIVHDLSTKAKKIIYQCTFPGCRELRDTVRSIESHVRVEHLHRPEEIAEEDEDEEDEEDEDRDHEEEFYYTEIEADGVLSYPSSVSSPPSGHMAALSLADHLDMARPAHEAPGAVTVTVDGAAIRRQAVAVPIQRRRVVTGGNAHPAHASSSTSTSLLSRSLPSHSSGISLAAHSSTGSPNKLILISPPSRPSGHSHSPSPLSPTSPMGSSSAKSPSKRPREGKKCRKVYGLEQRDLWCTQCKWKKACARFGSAAVVTSAVDQPAFSSAATPLLVAAPAAKAIKF